MARLRCYSRAVSTPWRANTDKSTYEEVTLTTGYRGRMQTGICQLLGESHGRPNAGQLMPRRGDTCFDHLQKRQGLSRKACFKFGVFLVWFYVPQVA